MSPNIEYILYGGISSSLARHRGRSLRRKSLVARSGGTTRHTPRCVFVSFSQDLDNTFVELFRKEATEDTRLLIFNLGFSTDRLVSRIVDLQIRTPQRFCVIDTEFDSGKTRHMAFVESLFKRLTSAFEADDNKERILDARIEDGILHVVSPDFDRLDVPLAKILNFRNAAPSKLQEFEIDDDGSFIYWPALDCHLGWGQLQQLLNPAAALKAAQKSQEFNKRYGNAVQKVRVAAGIRPGDISGISDKQLRRIEIGECRLTSSAMEALSEAHKLAPNEYMKKLAEVLD